METEVQLHEQIVQIGAIELHKLMKIFESQGGQVLDLCTDKIVCNFQAANTLPFLIRIRIYRDFIYLMIIQF